MTQIEMIHALREELRSAQFELDQAIDAERDRQNGKALRRFAKMVRSWNRSLDAAINVLPAQEPG